jgi:toxin FitB
LNFLLDTNVVSEWTRPRPEPRVVRWLADVDEDRVFLSVITIAELECGVDLLPAGRKRDRLAGWLADELIDRFEARILEVSLAIAREWGIVSALSQRAGRPLAAMDAFFAATARAYDLTLVTRNGADFDAAGVSLFDPWTA